MRSSPEPTIYHLEPPARKLLEQELVQRAGLCQTAWELSNAERRILRIVLGLQLLASPSSLDVQEPLMLDALNFYGGLMAERRRLLKHAMSMALEPTPENLLTMAGKVKEHQPIAPHKLRRLYDSDRRRWLTPLINQLLDRGIIFKDEKGRLLVPDNPSLSAVKEVNESEAK